jgi:hypothetical protein
MPNLDHDRETPSRSEHDAPRSVVAVAEVHETYADRVPDYGRLLELVLAAVMSAPSGKLRDEIEDAIDEEIATDGPSPTSPPRDTAARTAEIEVRLGRHYAFVAHCRAIGLYERLATHAHAHDVAIATRAKHKAEKAAEEAMTPASS